MSAKRTSKTQTARMVRTRRHLADEETRAELHAALKAAYLAGASIRDLAAEHDLAFGTARSLLLEAGVTLRPRGGANHVRPPEDEARQ